MNDLTVRQQKKLERVIDFHQDLLKLRDMLVEQEKTEKAATESYGRRPEPRPELEQVRQSLLRRVGPIKQLFEAVTRIQIIQPRPWSQGQVDAWYLALHPDEQFSQSHFAGVIADHLYTLIGTLEDNPSLVDQSKPQGQRKTDTGQAEDPRAVFVVHGRNDKAREAMFFFLRAIGLCPLEWCQAILATAKASPYVGEILDVAFAKAQAVVVLMTPDDEARLRKQFQGPKEPAYETALAPQARPNVLFEAGMAIGRHPNRTVLVELAELRPFSDIGGRHVIKLDNSTQKRQELAQRLRIAGCPVDLTGTDWQTTGDFAAATAIDPDL